MQMQYGILLATVKRHDSSVHCLVQGCHKLETANGQAFTNPYDCPLLELSQTVFCTPSNNIRREVSLVHECGNSCTFLETTAMDNVEREEVSNWRSSMIGRIICIATMFIVRSN